MDNAFRFRPVTGKVKLNDFGYRLQEGKDYVTVRVLERILVGYDDLTYQRLNERYPGKDGKGQGRHLMREVAGTRGCRCR